MFTSTCNYHRLAVNGNNAKGKLPVLMPEISNATVLSSNKFQGKTGIIIYTGC